MDQTLWESALKLELKTDQIERFLKRALPEGGEQPLLSQKSQAWSAPANQMAALSYTFTGNENVQQTITDLLKLGVWDFIVDPFLLGWDQATLDKNLSSFKNPDARVWVLGHGVLHASTVVAKGGHAVHEMAELLCQIIQWAEQGGSKQIGVAVNCDREFFKSIAKIRAMKALTWNVLVELKQTDLYDNIRWIARSSWRDFTAFDAASNILRNATALSAGLIARADVVESLPYDLLIQSDSVVHERAQRLAITSQLVLQQEAGLGEVQDAATGSFALEELTRTLGAKAWELMQQLSSASDRAAVLAPLIEAHWGKTQQQFNTRKLVQTGVNDFPEATERLQLKARFQKNDHQRLGLAFEQLRLKAQEQAKNWKVALVVIGDYAALNARLSFTKNFFELLGLTVIETGKGLTQTEAAAWAEKTQANVWAIVAADADHEGLSISAPAGVRTYLAGKTTKVGMQNIFAGMDVRASLEKLLGGGK